MRLTTKIHHLKTSSTHLRYKPMAIALLSVLSQSVVHAADTGLGFLNNSANTSWASRQSRAYAISADGTVVVGGSVNSDDAIEAFRWSNGSMSGLGFLNNSTDANWAQRDGQANAVNADGSVVVGASMNSDSVNEAFRWSNGAMSGLGFLASSTDISWSNRYSEASGISADGLVVVGHSRNSDGFYEAFRWNNGVMTGLGFLNASTDVSWSSRESYASDVSSDGSVVVGDSRNSDGFYEAFRWNSGVMTGLGFLNASTDVSWFSRESYASDVSSDGSVVVGTSRNSDGFYEAFRWVDGSGMSGLGFLNANTDTNWASRYSTALAVNATGSVVVGKSTNSNGSSEAFRWTAGTNMISVSQWLTNAGVTTTGLTLTTAADVSADGDTVVGSATNSDGKTEGYIARVSDSASGGSSGIVGLTDLSRSVSQSLAPSQQMENLVWLSMNGAHHRPLMEMAVGNSNSCAWSSGDAGRVHRSANGYTGLIEVGACHDLAADGLRIGAGLGASFSNMNLANDGHSRMQGQYGLAEVDWQLPNKPLLASLLGVYGKWDANLRRGYAISGTQPSSGDTDITSYSVRARLDWQDAFHLGQVGFSPRIAYTVTRSEIDAYQEEGGSAPAYFEDQNHTSQELRVGMTGKYRYNDKVTLLGHAEATHRFDENGAAVRGNVDALGVDIGFNLKGNAVSQDWVRIGAEADYQLSDRSTINASSFVASAGEDADITAAVSYRLAF